MRFQRPFTPPPHERAHVTAGLRLLAEYMEQAPHVFTLQQDKRALLRPDELRQVADAICNAPMEDAFQPFFYLEEQESVRVGLMALKDMRRLYGERATNLYFHELFQAQNMDVATPAELDDLITLVSAYPPIEQVHRQLGSPHKAGQTVSTVYIAHDSADLNEPGQHRQAPPAAVFDPDVSPIQQATPAPCI